MNLICFNPFGTKYKLVIHPFCGLRTWKGRHFRFSMIPHLSRGSFRNSYAAMRYFDKVYLRLILLKRSYVVDGTLFFYYLLSFL